MMGVENAIQEAGDKGITIFEYFWQQYPLYTALILIGFFILIILALLPRRTIHIYEEPYGHSPQTRQREVVIHHPPPQQPHVVHVYDEDPIEDEEPIATDRKRRRFDLDDFDLTDNYGFFD